MIKTHDLVRTYELGKVRVEALKSTNVEIKEGEIVTMMGKSGSGKSTFLRLIALLDSITSGEILFDGQPTSKLSEREKADIRLKKVGYVFQEYALLPELSALNNVYLPGLMLSDENINYKSRAKELLNQVGLGDRIDHLPRELSGGEQQRVAIARALINSPKYLFADEPCANLDTLSSDLVMDTLVNINKELGVTILFVSHDPDDKKYANREIFLKDGNIVEPYF